MEGLIGSNYLPGVSIGGLEFRMADVASIIARGRRFVANHLAQSLIDAIAQIERGDERCDFSDPRATAVFTRLAAACRKARKIHRA